MIHALLIAFALLASAQPILPPPAPPSTAPRAMAQISPDRCRASVDALVAFGTRHTLSETESDDRGIGAARRWVADQFRAAGDNVVVEFESFIQPAGRRIPEDTEIVNVVARIPGTSTAARHYVVLAHLDSRNSDPLDGEGDAPGANDDASGVALLIELANVLADKELESTIVLVATSGEEQGLHGARYHAEQAKAGKVDIRAVLSNDMVGDPGGPTDENGQERRAPLVVRIFSEGIPRNATDDDIARIRRLAGENDSPSRGLARYITEVGAKEENDIHGFMVFRPDRFLRGGDHTPSNELGFPAVRFTEVHENYDRQHQDVREEDGRQYGDLSEHVDENYIAGVARLNTAALVHLANAPSSPQNVRMVVADLSPNTLLRWDPSPEDDVAGYEIMWRDTVAHTWQYARDIGDVTEFDFPASKDNFLFAVRAYDKDGYRSPATFADAASE